MKKIKSSPRLADQYLLLKARMAELAKEELAIKKALLLMGMPVVEGEIARVTISEVPGRVTYDADALRKYVPAKTLAMCEKVSESSTRFSVKSKLSSVVPIAA